MVNYICSAQWLNQDKKWRWFEEVINGEEASWFKHSTFVKLWMKMKSSIWNLNQNGNICCLDVECGYIDSWCQLQLFLLWQQWCSQMLHISTASYQICQLTIFRNISEPCLEWYIILTKDLSKGAKLNHSNCFLPF